MDLKDKKDNLPCVWDGKCRGSPESGGRGELSVTRRSVGVWIGERSRSPG